MAESSQAPALHIAVFADQHPGTLGGMQTSVLLQQRFLERLGHRVTIVAPARRRLGHEEQPAMPSVIELPGVPLGPGEYSLSVPTRRLDARLDRALDGWPPVDVVHIQADFWGAVIGYRFAQRHGTPVVHTMHNRLDVGLAATVPLPWLVQRGFGLAQHRLMRLQGPVPKDAWTYLRGFTDAAAAVTAPSTHFASLLEEHNVFDDIDVVPTGLDDDIARDLIASPPARGEHDDRIRLVWTGRFSPEKRLIPFLEAVLASKQGVDVHVFGDGAQRAKAESLVARHLPMSASRAGGPRFVFRGKVTYEQMLAELAAADALVQTSIGFETQGMTVFEAAALGTPTILSDHRIAADLPGGSYWLTPDDTVAGLAGAISGAVAQIGAGRRWRATGADQLMQSRQTSKMMEVYRRVTRPEGARGSTVAGP
ncbi:glycosyltransferase family 4 protein [Zhihengliuella halotolerans]|uniref:D-inositol 3-phosphate glycosyltransferase n=1 Tax=Zhihengliuella halotolerans TaxID=370736 RepID=A0A4Q8ACL7_9MICC|nr:glycosyltransferase family 4 protein [Zhihengliuella halotolerans]RZU61957.1 glycosyltransferase involved in cell wall biosynthesis [Zhihengliuella halotolerans]